MTRVNLIPVEQLTDQHLMAEWRELKMVPAALRRSLATKSLADILESIPERYTLNKGHVRFFYNKMGFLAKRYESLTAELLDRGYNLSDTSPFSKYTYDLPEFFFFKVWTPDADEIAINQERITQKLQMKSGWYRYRSQIIEDSRKNLFMGL